ncbi:MAG: hypothetical protein ACUVT3_02935, partial [Ignavibacterium sp.]
TQDEYKAYRAQFADAERYRAMYEHYLRSLQTTINPPNPNIAAKKDADLILPPSAYQQIPQVSTNLKLNINSTTQLIVDGKTLASIIKNYIWEDLVKYLNTSTAATQSYTIV